tara:strand:+ start:331 stop:537 length:207 start_codon:yes stop_codon:yes gene_type:complete
MLIKKIIDIRVIFNGSKISDIKSITFSKNQNIYPLIVRVNLKKGKSTKTNEIAVRIVTNKPKLIDLKI